MIKTLADTCIMTLITKYRQVSSLVGLPQNYCSIFFEKARHAQISTCPEFLLLFLEYAQDAFINLILDDSEFRKIRSNAKVQSKIMAVRQLNSLVLSGVISFNDDCVLLILHLVNLKVLNLSFTSIGDVGLSHLIRPIPSKGLKMLEFLDISGTRIKSHKLLLKLVLFPVLSCVNVSYIVTKKDALQMFKDLKWRLINSKFPIIGPYQDDSIDLSVDFKACLLDYSLDYLNGISCKIQTSIPLDPYLAVKPRLVFTRNL